MSIKGKAWLSMSTEQKQDLLNKMANKREVS